MQPFRVLEAIAAPLLMTDISTDTIIPMERMIHHSISRQGLGVHLFAPLRYRPDGSENPDFILNCEPYRNAEILVTGENFGCGSSREAAVWALLQYGIRCVIAPSFGEILRNNCFKNGVLPVTLTLQTIEQIATVIEREESSNLTVDLEHQVVKTAVGDRSRFLIEPFRRDMLIKGLDQLAYAQSMAADIKRFETEDALQRPWIAVQRRVR